MQFVIGAAGAFLFVGVLAAGLIIGWKAHAKYSVQKSNEKVTEDELREMKQKEEAFRAMNGYSVEDAYGMRGVDAS